MGRVLPIALKTWEVKAVLSNKKASKRMVVKFPVNRFTDRIPEAKDVMPYKNIVFSDEVYFKEEPHYCFMVKPPYQPGDILYVKETWCRGSLDYKKEQYYYKADNNEFTCFWHPSVHMPKEAARIWLKVTGVGIEHLQDIDGNGILAEGLEIGCPFEDIWDSTVKKSDRKKYGWEANPWVWVIRLERREKPESEV